MINTSSSYKGLSNREKGKILENLVSDVLSDFLELGYTVLSNIKRSRGDVDHLLINHLNREIYVFEDKNLNSDFRLYIGWFKTHVIDRFQHLPKIVSNYLERGYQVKRVLIISRFTVADEAVHNLIKKYSIEVIEVGKQILKQSKKWASLIKTRLSCLLKLSNSYSNDHKLRNRNNDLDSESFDSDMTGKNLKLLNFSNYLKDENYGIKLKTLHKQFGKWGSLVKRRISYLLKLYLDHSKDHSFVSNSSVSGSLDLELNNNFEGSECHTFNKNRYFEGFNLRLSNYLSILCSKTLLVFNHVKDSYLSRIKESIKLFISNTQANVTLLDFLPEEIRKENDTIQNSENPIKSKKRDSYYFLYPDDEESEQPIWLRSLKEIVTDTENYPRRWARYIYPIRKAQKLGIVNSENTNEWNELADSYSKQYFKFPIRRIAEEIYNTYLQYQGHLNDYLNTLKQYEDNHSNYQSLIFDSTAKLKGLAIALEKRMLRRYWKLYR